MILSDVSPHPTRYNQFEFVEGQGVGQIPFPYEGQYNYYAYAQPFGSGNLNPLQATELVENGIADFIVVSADTTNENYFEFISNDEFNSNTIFAPDEINPVTPTATVGITPTPTSSVTPTATPTNTPTETPTQTATPSTTATAGMTPTATETQTPTPTNTNTPSQTQTSTPTQTTTQTPTTSTSPTPTPTGTAVPFAPSSLSNLQQWYISTSGATVSSWTNYGLLGGSVSQGTATRQPQIINSTLGSYSGTAVQFVGRDFMTGTFTSTNYSSSTVFMVTKIVGVDPNGWSLYLYSTGTNNVAWSWQSYASSSQSVAIKNPGNYISIGRSIAPLLLATSGTSNSFFTASFNDNIPTSASTLFSGTTAVNFDFGYDPGTTSSTNIEMYEVIVYNRVLNSTEYGNVMNYLKTKYQYNTW